MIVTGIDDYHRRSSQSDRSIAWYGPLPSIWFDTQLIEQTHSILCILHPKLSTLLG